MNWIQFLFGLSVGGNLVFFGWWLYSLDLISGIKDLNEFFRREIAGLRQNNNDAQKKIYQLQDELKEKENKDA